MIHVFIVLMEYSWYSLVITNGLNQRVQVDLTRSVLLHLLSLFRKFNQNFVAQLWYFVKCIYFGLSAYQIRCGYPTRILGNFLTKKYNHLNLFLFQGYGHKASLTHTDTD